MTPNKISEISKKILQNRLSVVELDELAGAIQMARKRLADRNKWEMQPGDRITFNSKRLGAGVAGKLVKINRKKALVNLDFHGMWNVPIHMLQKEV